HDVKRVIAALPKERQSLFFSATMPEEVSRLADGLLRDPVRVAVTPEASTAERGEQRLYFVERPDKRPLLADLRGTPALARALGVTGTERGEARLADQLDGAEIRAAALDGTKGHGARQTALDDFKSGRVRAHVATDIAARGIDVEGVTHVVNYELTNVAE